MILWIENKTTVKQKKITEGIYFYYDRNSYLELLNLLFSSWKSRKYLNLDLITLDTKLTEEDILSKIVIGKLSIQNIWLWHTIFPQYNYYLVK